MITCPKCGNQLPDNTKFCKYCGNQLSSSVVQRNVQTNFSQAPVQTKSSNNPENKKYIYAIIALVLIIAIVAGILFSVLNSKESEQEKKLRKILEDSTTKPIVEYLCEDFDSNGKVEVFAVVGKTNNKNAEHPEYYDADICYVNFEKAEIIKENVSGKSNGTITVDDNIYVSLEVYEEGSKKGYSFIYTADGDTFEEPEISGKYSDVHEEDGKIIAIDDGQKIEIEITDDFEEVTTENKSDTETTTVSETTTAETTTKKTETTTKAPAPVSEGKIIEPNASDFEKLNSFIYDCEDGGMYDYDCTSADATKKAYNYMWGNGTAWFFEGTYNISGTELTSDPLGKFNGWMVECYPAKEVDSFIKNVLNATPDRSVTGYSEEGSVLYYYYGDKFYIAQGARGDIPATFTTTYTSLGNGKYKTDTAVWGADKDKPYCKISATVALKSVNGKRVWSVYSYNHYEENRPGAN